MSSIGRIVRKNHSALFWCTRHYPKAKREAVYTLYALVKHFDDLSSSSLPEKDKADILAAWQREIANIYDRKVPETDIGRRIYKNCMRFKLPRACMETMLSGFAMDCPKPLFRPSLHEFEEYCRGVSETPSYLILKVIAEFATAMWSRRPRWPSSSRPATPSAPPAPVPAVRTWKATSSVWRIWRRSLPASRASSRPLPFRQAAKCASWSSPMSSATIRSSCWLARSQRRSRTRWITPARSRSTSSARAAPSITQNKILSRSPLYGCSGLLFVCPGCGSLEQLSSIQEQ